MWKIKSWPVKCNMEGNQRGLCAEQAVPICGTAPPRPRLPWLQQLPR